MSSASLNVELMACGQPTIALTPAPAPAARPPRLLPRVTGPPRPKSGLLSSNLPLAYIHSNEQTPGRAASQHVSDSAAGVTPQSARSPLQGRQKNGTGKKARYTGNEWQSMKAIIKDLYVVQNQPLNQVSSTLMTMHGFDASPQMYKKKLREWQFFKNESIRKPNARIPDRTQMKCRRSRAVRSLPQLVGETSQRSLPRPELAIPTPGYLETPEGKALSSMLSSISEYFKTLFDQGRDGDSRSGWTGDSFQLIPPSGREDFSSEWKTIADQCHGASSLLRIRDESDGKCQRTLFNIIRGFEKVALQDDPWMLVYLWRAILYLRGISFRLERHKSGLPSACLGPRNDHLVGHVLSGFAIFITINKGRDHAMVRCLYALRTFPLVTMKLALERVCDMVINLFRKYLGDSHPVVLSMTGHFLKYWPRKLGEHVLSSYDRLVRNSEETFGPRDKRTITFLTEYMYTTHYHAHDDSLTYTLALDLWERTNALGTVPQWGKEAYAHTLASKMLARLDKNRGNTEGWRGRLNAVAGQLRNGDRECQTRALQLRLMMADWYQKAGDKDRAQKEAIIAEEIRHMMRYLALRDGGWKENLPFRRA